MLACYGSEGYWGIPRRAGWSPGGTGKGKSLHWGEEHLRERRPRRDPCSFSGAYGAIRGEVAAPTGESASLPGFLRVSLP